MPVWQTGYPEGIPAMPTRHAPEQRYQCVEIAWAIIVLAAVVFLSIRGAIIPALALVPLLPKSELRRKSRRKVLR
jgi:hypothetical protein